MASKKKLEALEIIQPTKDANYFIGKGKNEEGVDLEISSVSLHGLRSAALANGFTAEQVDFGDLTDGGQTEAHDAEREAEAANEGTPESSSAAASTGNASSSPSAAGSTTGSSSRASAKASTT